MNDIIAAQDTTVDLVQPIPQPVLAEAAEITKTSSLNSEKGAVSAAPKRESKRKEDEDGPASMSNRLRQTTDNFNFDDLLSLASNSDMSASRLEASSVPLREDTVPITNGASQQQVPRSPQERTKIDELERGPGTDITLLLVEQLTKTNERLEKLEAALREVSLLAALQREPIQRDASAASTETADKPAADAANDRTEPAAADANQEAEALFRSGVALCQMKNFNEAVAAWQQVLLLQPDNAYAMANIGIVYTEQARWAEARDTFARVLRLQPDNAEASFGLGMADAQLGNYTAAIAALENTLRLQPDNADARYNLALVRQRMALSTSVLRNGSQAAHTSQAHNEKDARANGMLNGMTSQKPEPEQAVPVPSSPPSQAAGFASLPMQTESKEVPAAIQNRPPMKRRAGLARLGLSAAAIIILAGGLFYYQYLASHATHGSAGTPRASAVTDSVPAHPETADLSPLVSAVKPIAPPLVVPRPTKAAASSQPISVHRTMRDLQPEPRRTVFNERPSRPHWRTGLKTRAVAKSHLSRQGAHTASSGSANPGYNRGVDKLLDQMP